MIEYDFEAHAKSQIDKALGYLEGFSKGYHQAKSEWVGLTDDEFNELYDKYVPESCYALLIEKVEAKLKDKNT